MQCLHHHHTLPQKLLYYQTLPIRFRDTRQNNTVKSSNLVAHQLPYEFFCLQLQLQGSYAKTLIYKSPINPKSASLQEFYKEAPY